MAAAIQQEVIFNAPPARVYEALTDAKRFSQLSGGAPADISREAGGAFSVFGGVISGRNIELVPDRRIVQAWRVGNWAEGVYSLIRIELHADGKNTRMAFEHVGFPDDQKEHLAAGWHAQYWDPLKKYLG